ncbi:Uncharacterised protein [Amycolatopsis camponoti]|uniref:ATPase n=1 Tax=Amycolatopsis camponoti TaxID=2606593 RepID=A0A6I8LMX7_9PSEU|nr:Uncharacterised protein [Amycolatopsis camponoti]
MAHPADRLPAAVEVSARIYVRRPEEVASELQRQMNKVRSQVKHYTDEHELEPPQSLSRQAGRVLEIDDEMTSGFTALATRVRSWWRLAVSGPTERDALRLAQQLLDLYKPKIAIEHPEAQYAMAREFIPGEPLASAAYMRRGSVVWASSAVPTATAEVGDRRGILLGETCTATRRPVAWDPWMAQEIRDGSGLTAMVAGLGGGKSFLGGGIVYKTLRAGANWTILDPSGPLSRLCDLPELRPYARPINLLNAQPGILNPYRVVAEQKDGVPREYWTDAESLGVERLNLLARLPQRSAHEKPKESSSPSATATAPAVWSAPASIQRLDNNSAVARPTAARPGAVNGGSVGWLPASARPGSPRTATRGPRRPTGTSRQSSATARDRRSPATSSVTGLRAFSTHR